MVEPSPAAGKDIARRTGTSINDKIDDSQEVLIRQWLKDNEHMPNLQTVEQVLSRPRPKTDPPRPPQPGATDEQLDVWAQRAGVDIISSQTGADPSSVVFDTLKAAKTKDVDVVLIDTAGRQQTNVNLMDELGKVNRVAKPNLKIFVGSPAFYKPR